MGNNTNAVVRGGKSPLRYLSTFCKHLRALACHGSSKNVRSLTLRYNAVREVFLGRRSLASSNFLLVLDPKRYSDSKMSAEVVSLSLCVADPAWRYLA